MALTQEDLQRFSRRWWTLACRNAWRRFAAGDGSRLRVVREFDLRRPDGQAKCRWK
jgi:hypothetical protein